MSGLIPVVRPTMRLDGGVSNQFVQLPADTTPVDLKDTPYVVAVAGRVRTSGPGIRTLFVCLDGPSSGAFLGISVEGTIQGRIRVGGSWSGISRDVTDGKPFVAGLAVIDATMRAFLLHNDTFSFGPTTSISTATTAIQAPRLGSTAWSLAAPYTGEIFGAAVSHQALSDADIEQACQLLLAG